MPIVPNPLLQQYAKLTEFLGCALGPDYEVVLHDLTDKNRSITAIANGQISGREIGAPLGSEANNLLEDRAYETSDFCLHHYGLSVNGKELRSSTLFIKQNGRVVGMLCINFDDSRYRDLSARLMGLCRRDLFLAAGDESPAEPAAPVIRPAAPELAVSRGRVSSETAAQEAIAHELEGLDVAADRLTSDERLKVIAALDERGVFLIKGAVKDVATALGCSQASVYRYLTQLKNDKKLKQEA